MYSCRCWNSSLATSHHIYSDRIFWKIYGVSTFLYVRLKNLSCLFKSFSTCQHSAFVFCLIAFISYFLFFYVSVSLFYSFFLVSARKSPYCPVFSLHVSLLYCFLLLSLQLFLVISLSGSDWVLGIWYLNGCCLDWAPTRLTWARPALLRRTATTATPPTPWWAAAARSYGSAVSPGSRHR